MFFLSALTMFAFELPFETGSQFFFTLYLIQKFFVLVFTIRFVTRAEPVVFIRTTVRSFRRCECLMIHSRQHGRFWYCSPRLLFLYRLQDALWHAWILKVEPLRLFLTFFLAPPSISRGQRSPIASTGANIRDRFVSGLYTMYINTWNWPLCSFNRLELHSQDLISNPEKLGWPFPFDRWWWPAAEPAV